MQKSDQFQYLHKIQDQMHIPPIFKQTINSQQSPRRRYTPISSAILMLYHQLPIPPHIFQMFLKATVCLCVIFLALAQQAPGIIETKRIAFGQSNAMVLNAAQSQFALTFERTFTMVPRLGLAVYTMDFEYSPTFSCTVNSTTPTSAVLQVATSNTGTNNQLYLMYMATDHPSLGIYMPGAFVTDQLNMRLRQNSQSKRFNYKQQILTTSLATNIRLQVFMTGISMTSELTNNGYSVNRTYFKMTATKLALPFYNITVEVQSMFGDITIAQIEYTVVYFDVVRISTPTTPAAMYLMESGGSSFGNFGGTAAPTVVANTLAPLPVDPNYQGNFLFYGIREIDCIRGPSITFSAYPTIATSTSGVSEFILNAEAWKLTFIISGAYSYIQYRTRLCNLTFSNCNPNCLTSPIPHFTLNGICQFCHYSCLTCSIAASTTKCDTCHSSRTLSPATQLCECNAGFYDIVRNNYTCASCFPCATCSVNSQVCLSCYANLSMVKNSVLSVCQCTIGFYPNYLNGSNQLNSTAPCLGCPVHCLNCLNASFCLACDLQTYLTDGRCFLLCNSLQSYTPATDTCSSSTNSALFDQSGRLGYDWTYQSSQSGLNFTLTFSQTNTLFYYYENQTGYSFSSAASSLNQQESNMFFFDDGKRDVSGYVFTTGGTSQQNIQNIGIAALSGGAAVNSAGINFDSKLVDIAHLNGSYLGISEQYYYYLAYYFYSQRTGIQTPYTDRFGIPYGKVNLTVVPPVTNQNFLDALSNNLVINIGTDTIPYKITASSASTYIVTTGALPRSYYGEVATLSLKNRGLVRSGAVASQVGAVAHPVSIYVCTVPADVSAAASLFDSNSIIVQVLWGVCKYPLFIGFGWIFMPLMLVLMSIMNLNYIDTQRPLNLNMFLASFADLRNPSILYNPVRDNMDTSIFSHPEIYRTIPAFNVFDRGIDFMKNSFQFFFVPFLAVILLLLLVGFNKIVNRVCKKDIPLISEYLQPRLPLLIGAYALIQALPITFFFFAQLNDTRFSNPNQPSASYPVFNIAMSYLAFFLTCSIPFALLAFVYYRQTNKQTKVKTGSQLIMVFNQLLQSMPFTTRRAYYTDALWTCYPDRIVSYGFGVSVFFLMIFYGFFTSFFYDSFGWQITGLIIATTLIGFFAVANDAFESVIIKGFWILFSLLMLAFLFLLAALGSNISTAPCGLQTLGYLAIGFLYALVILGIIASIYLLWMTLYNLYNVYCKNRAFIIPLDKKIEGNQREAERHVSMKEHNKTAKSRMMSKSNFSQYNIGSDAKLVPGAVYNRPNYVENDNPDTAGRLREEENQDQDDEHIQVRERLIYDKIDGNGDYIYLTDRSRKPFRFNSRQGQTLYNYPRIYIEPNGDVVDPQGLFIVNHRTPQSDNASQSNQQHRHLIIQKPERESQTNIIIHRSRPQIQETEEDYNSIYQTDKGRKDQVEVVVKNRYILNGEEYEKISQLPNGQVVMRNVRNGATMKVDPRTLTVVAEGDSVNGSRRDVNGSRREVTSSRKEIINSTEEIYVRSNKPQEATELVDAALANEISSNVVYFDKNRKIKTPNKQYIMMGSDSDGMVRAYNNDTRRIEKIPEADFQDIMLDSINYRVNLNGTEYDIVENEEGRVMLREVSNAKRVREIDQKRLLLLKKQNQDKIREMIGVARQGINRTGGYTITSNQQEYVRQTEPPKPPSSSYAYANNLLLLQSKATNNNNNNTSSRQININNVGNSSNYIKTEVRQSEKEIVDARQTFGRNQDIEMVRRTSEKKVESVGGGGYRQVINQGISSNYQNYNGRDGSSNNYNVGSNSNNNNYTVTGNTITTNTIRQGQPITTQSTRNIQQHIIRETQPVSPPPLYQHTSIQQEVLDEDPDTIEYILKHDKGPYTLFAMRARDVEEVDGEDHYEKEKSIEQKIVFGHDVMRTLAEMEQRHPGCVVFMVNRVSEEEYRIN